MKYRIICFMALMMFSLSAMADGVIWPSVQTLKRPDADNVYDRPYSLTENKIDKKLLYQNTGGLIGASVATMGILYLMPTGFTNWDDDDHRSPTRKWWDNVSHRPVWDKDDFFLNYVTHPYAGAVYYMGARSAGANAYYSGLYSFALSTFFWEYGIEAFAERPSIQDLIVTPVFGSVLGECFYQGKRALLDNNRELWGSRALGQTAIFLMDPMTEISQFFFDNKSSKQNFSFSSQPFLSQKQSLGYGLHMTIHF
ncbi:MAG: DUF3943 domain-containing protein [Pseudomonadota bacterium]|nr:DUF3943 domain-containing protein [Pseudomonadota bacterium]